MIKFHGKVFIYYSCFLLVVSLYVDVLEAFSVPSINNHVRVITGPPPSCYAPTYSKSLSYRFDLDLGRDDRFFPLHSSIYASNSYQENSGKEERLSGPIKFSLSTIRSSLRAMTGLSLTATRTALRTMTGVSVTSIVKAIVGIFKPWMRYFLQPFLIIYYVPLTCMKYFIGTTKTYRAEQLAAHEKLVEGWKDAIRAAEEKLKDQFPLHVSEDGSIQTKSNILKEDIPGFIVSAIERQYEEESASKH